MARASIVLKGDFVRKEVEATEAITPGHQVSFAGAKGAGGRKAFALENDLIGRSISDAYASGETVQVGVFQPGAEIQALLAQGENVAVGAALEADGSGALQALSTGVLLAFALEAVDNSASGAPEARIRVEIA